MSLLAPRAIPLSAFRKSALANRDFNLCLVIDGTVQGLRRYWPLPDADDYRAQADQWCPGWQHFEVYEGSVDLNALHFVGRPLCGSVRMPHV